MEQSNLTITEVHPDGKPDYANTYWCQKGKHEALDKELRKLVPSYGKVENADSNPALEKYRVASNCYYDLYNNGLGNRAEEFISAFGFCAIALVEEGHDDCDDFSGHEHRDHPIDLTQEVIDRTESEMDKIIIAAAHEQHIGETLTGTVDITPVGMTSPEGRKRVAEAQKEWEDATHHLANELRECIDAVFDRDTNKTYKAELYSQLQTLIGIRDRKQEAFLRAVAGVDNGLKADWQKTGILK